MRESVVQHGENGVATGAENLSSFADREPFHLFLLKELKSFCGEFVWCHIIHGVNPLACRTSPHPSITLACPTTPNTTGPIRALANLAWPLHAAPRRASVEVDH